MKFLIVTFDAIFMNIIFLRDMHQVSENRTKEVMNKKIDINCVKNEYLHKSAGVQFPVHLIGQQEYFIILKYLVARFYFFNKSGCPEKCPDFLLGFF